MITSPIYRPSAVRASAALSLLWCCSCQVYDPGLVEEHETRRDIRGSEDRDPRDATAEADAAETDAAASCGDGIVSEGEACDIAIARGEPGACPTGCSGGQGCLHNELEGEGCAAHCVMREWKTATPDDGCCPKGKDYFEDNDCAARCGNEHLEPGEMCDPVSTCPREEACTSSDACVVARYTGAADSCNARCEMMRIGSCVTGDRCCPAGCDRDRDGDCAMGASPEPSPKPAATPTPLPRPAPQPEPQPMAAAFVCANEHKGSACKACDCSKCAAETEACINDPGADDAKNCAAAIDCSERVKCNSNECYCGTATAAACEMTPTGMCLAAWHDAAYSDNEAVVRFHARTEGYTLNKVIALVDCRAKNCSRECGITP